MCDRRFTEASDDETKEYDAPANESCNEPNLRFAERPNFAIPFRSSIDFLAQDVRLLLAHEHVDTRTLRPLNKRVICYEFKIEKQMFKDTTDSCYNGYLDLKN